MSSPVGLVTGFEPFADLPSNPAEAVLSRIDGNVVAGVPLVARRIPVSFARAPAILADLVTTIRPAFVLSLGLAAGAPVPRVEMLAINAANAGVPDNDGAAPSGGGRFCEGPEARRATWNGPAVVAAIEEEGIPARLSLHAGGHLCNLTLYTVLGLLEGTSAPCGFLHLPHTPDEIVWLRKETAAGRRPGSWEHPSMPLDLQARAVRAAATVMARQAVADRPQ